jgi:hypothetical protein
VFNTLTCGDFSFLPSRLLYFSRREGNPLGRLQAVFFNCGNICKVRTLKSLLTFFCLDAKKVTKKRSRLWKKWLKMEGCHLHKKELAGRADSLNGVLAQTAFLCLRLPSALRRCQPPIFLTPFFPRPGPLKEEVSFIMNIH